MDAVSASTETKSHTPKKLGTPFSSVSQEIYKLADIPHINFGCEFL